jgi:hypothetical protein
MGQLKTASPEKLELETFIKNIDRPQQMSATADAWSTKHWLQLQNAMATTFTDVSMVKTIFCLSLCVNRKNT